MRGAGTDKRQGVANALAADARSPSLIHAAQQSFVDGWQHPMWVGFGVMVGVLIYVLARGPKPPTPAPDDLSPTGAVPAPNATPVSTQPTPNSRTFDDPVDRVAPSHNTFDRFTSQSRVRCGREP
ncbi:hypothetical protein AB0M22_20355 [Nocardia sp. NPDC051756]|uniref:hypothetical protein n=1 Tax=Nocardia sp. NPDC051756 TaxID=3154751 RepID=UPI00343A4084